MSTREKRVKKEEEGRKNTKRGKQKEKRETTRQNKKTWIRGCANMPSYDNPQCGMNPKQSTHNGDDDNDDNDEWHETGAFRATCLRKLSGEN